MKNLHIYIPTLKRLDHQTTYDRMPAQVRKNITMVCPKEEVKEHEARGRLALAGPVGIAPTRDFIVKHAYEAGQKKIVMFDDDITSQRRRADGKITDCSPEEVVEALGWLERTLDTVVHCGWSTRFLGYGNPATVAEPSRMMHCLAYRVDELARLGVGFSKNMLDPRHFAIDDMNMTIQLLLLGYPNRVSLEWRLRTMGSNAVGGASTWRTAQQQSYNSLQLATVYPQCVKRREKKAWPGMESATMYDVIVYWQKALKLGRSK